MLCQDAWALARLREALRLGDRHHQEQPTLDQLPRPETMDDNSNSTSSNRKNEASSLVGAEEEYEEDEREEKAVVVMLWDELSIDF